MVDAAVAAVFTFRACARAAAEEGEGMDRAV